MAFVLADRVEQVTRTTGTADLQLAETLRGRQSFQDVTSDGDTVIYVLEDAQGSEWEVGLGTVTHGTPTILERTTVRQSSNSDAKISLSAGTHRVYLTADAQYINDTIGGASIGQSDLDQAITDHKSETDPHSQYTTASEAASAAPVQSVNSQAGTVSLGAINVPYDNTISGLAASELQAAVDELAASGGSGTDDQTAAEVTYSNSSSGLSATNVQAAIDEVGSDLSTHVGASDPHPQYTTFSEAAAAAPVQSVNGESGAVSLSAADVGAAPSGHVGAGGTAHAEATTSTAGFMSSTDKTKLDGVEANAKDDQSAAEVPYTNTASGLAATQVQAAIDEVDGDLDAYKADLASSTATEGSDLVAHTGSSDTVTEALDKRTVFVGSVAELEALTATDGDQVSLGGSEAGRFEFDSTNTTTPDGYYFVAPDSAPTGASGVWVRRPDSFKGAATNAVPRLITSKARERVSLKDALGDNYTPTEANATDTTTAIQSLYDEGFKDIFLNYDNLYINSTLLFDPYAEVRGLGKGGLNGPTKIIVTSGAGKISAFAARDPSSGGNVASKFTNLSINHADALAGSGQAAIDLTGCSHGIITDVSARGWTEGLLFGEVAGTSGGQYHDIFGAEIANSVRGMRFNTAANSIRVIGGRIHSNLVGIFATTCNDVFISNVIENNELGMDLRTGTQGFNFNGRFEGNGKDLSTNDLIPTSGACIMRSGSKNNKIDAFCSGGADRIIDLDGRNSVRSLSTGYTGQHNFATKNLAHNGSMQQDDNGDGLANELTLSQALPAGMSVSLDATTKVSGDQSQKVTVDATGTSRTDIQRVLRVTEGVPCNVSVRVKLDYNAGWNIRVGRSGGGTEYGNIPVYDSGDWQIITVTFIPTSSLVYLTFYMSQAIADGTQSAAVNLWIDSLAFSHGVFPPMLGEFERLISPRGDTRPAVTQPGEQFFDTTLGKPIWFKGPGWVDATGSAV